jgi:flagellar biosynthesis protein FlhG
MSEQTEKLRRLVTQATGVNPRPAGPRLLVVSGGKPGVGATTVAVNLASTLASDALRVVLVDADFSRASIAAQCGISDAVGIGDVLAGRRSVHEAIQRGPAGLQIIAGWRAAEPRGGIPERVSQRVVRQFQSLAPHVDWVVVDCGHESRSLVSEFWSAAEQVLLVTSPDAVAVMDSYSLVKTLLSRQSLAEPLALVVNQADDEASAADVHRRIDQSCQRFLGVSLDFAGDLPGDPAAVPAARGPLPLALRSPESPLAQSIQQLAERLLKSSESDRRERLAA